MTTAMKRSDWSEITANGLWPAPGLVGGVEGPGRQAPVEAQVALCVEWFERFTTTRKTINPNVTSYGLKHIVERHCGHYVSNGALIEAARRSGFTIRRSSEGSPNALFNVAVKRNVVHKEWR